MEADAGQDPELRVAPQVQSVDDVEAVELDSGREATLTPDRLRGMIDAYYAGRGLDPDGRPEPAVSAELGLDLFVHQR